MEIKKINQLIADDYLLGQFFLLHEMEICKSRTGGPYLRLLLGDGSQKLKAFMWEDFDDVANTLQVNTVVKVKGSLRSFRNEPSLTVQRIRPADEQHNEPKFDDFLPRSPVDIPASLTYLREMIDQLQSPWLRELLNRFFGETTFCEQFVRGPAAKNLHHNKVGGLLEHTISVVRLCAFLAEQYAEIDRDILLSAAMLHDIGKIVELSSETFDYTDHGRLIGHLFIGAQLIDHEASLIELGDDDMRTELLHAILAHHGSPEWGSPIVPMTLEAIVLHSADNLDAKLTSFIEWIDRNPDPSRENWSRYWPFMERFLYQRKRDTPETNEECTKENSESAEHG